MSSKPGPYGAPWSSEIMTQEAIIKTKYVVFFQDVYLRKSGKGWTTELAEAISFDTLDDARKAMHDIHPINEHFGIMAIDPETGASYGIFKGGEVREKKDLREVIISYSPVTGTIRIDLKDVS